jgi:hypothetical protein
MWRKIVQIIEWEKHNEKLEQDLYSGKPIQFITFKLSDEDEKLIGKSIEKILEFYRHPEFKEVTYSCIKELLVNGTKANLKYIYFNEQNLNINKSDDHKRGTQEFKEKISEDFATELGKIAKKKGLFVRLIINHEPHGLRIEAMNNTQINEMDNMRIREKLSNAMQCENILDFYMNFADDTEGEGIGLALVVVLLKESGIDPKHFRVFLKDKFTTARLEIPFTDRFIPTRYK